MFKSSVRTLRLPASITLQILIPRFIRCNTPYLGTLCNPCQRLQLAIRVFPTPHATNLALPPFLCVHVAACLSLLNRQHRLDFIRGIPVQSRFFIPFLRITILPCLPPYVLSNSITICSAESSSESQSGSIHPTGSISTSCMFVTHLFIDTTSVMQSVCNLTNLPMQGQIST
ncbi:hypothetical protein GGI35DRAFT_397904 [Trichoderma velutinum]